MSKASGLQTWEQSDFPILCPSCLGANPAIRMTKERFGQECKVCLKPFTVFRWCPGSGCRYRKTEICQICAKLKNVCQSCIFDLEYGLPVGVRDAVLQVKEKVPQQEVNRDYFMAVNANRLAKGEVGLINYKNADPASKAILEDLSERLNGKKTSDLELDVITEPIKKRNLPPVCSFYAKGSCSRGEYCPYRHELSTEKPATLKSYRDRFYGQDDPLADKLLERLPEIAAAAETSKSKPADKSVKALHVVGVRDGLTEEVLRHFFHEHGDVKSVKIMGTSAIVDFTTRLAAEDAAEHCIGSIDINGVSVRVSWAKIKSKGTSSTAKATDNSDDQVVDATVEAEAESPGKRRPPPPPKSSSKSQQL